MSITNSILSIFFLVVFYFSFLKRNLVFEEKWEVMKNLFFLIYPLYLFTLNIYLGIKLSIGFVFLIQLLNKFILEDKKVINILQVISMLGIMAGINYYLPRGISHETYVGVSYCFAAFFITFFDIVLGFKNQIIMKVVFMFMANLLILHIPFSSITVKI